MKGQPRRRKIRVTVFLILLSVACSSSLWAQDDEYRPWMQSAILGRCDSVVEAHVSKVSRLPAGGRLVRLTVGQVLSGSEPSSVLVMESSRRISVFRDLGKIVFLKKRPESSIRIAVDWVDLPKKDGLSRVELVSRIIAICGIGKPSLRASAMRGLVLNHLQSAHSWVRTTVIREFAELTRFHPEIFDSTAIIRLHGISRAGFGKDDERLFRGALGRVEISNAVGWTSERLVFPDSAAREKYLRQLARFEKSDDAQLRRKFLDSTLALYGRRVVPLFARFLGDHQEAIRRHCAVMLGELEAGAARKELSRRAMEDSSIDVRREALRALGKIGSVESVKILMEIAGRGKGRLCKEALTALAAINTGEAMLFLRDLARELKEDPESPAEIRWHLTYLLSPEFPKDRAAQSQKRRRKYR